MVAIYLVPSSNSNNSSNNDNDDDNNNNNMSFVTSTCPPAANDDDQPGQLVDVVQAGFAAIQSGLANLTAAVRERPAPVSTWVQCLVAAFLALICVELLHFLRRR
ncbi:hypothetical protein SCUCBS95973_001367 [Sporothrix curviconia]|uniref:Uncharacterized protein n=1 Tax=Sporothrix curviconia TaxID=1260050 RepID=A0ABP0AY62_9PEZI